MNSNAMQLCMKMTALEHEIVSTREELAITLEINRVLLSALQGVKGILDRAESNASGNLEWDDVAPRIAAYRAALAVSERENGAKIVGLEF